MTPRVMGALQSRWLRRWRNGIIQGLGISGHVLAGVMSVAVMLVAGASSGGAAVSECGKIDKVAGAKYCYHRLGTAPQYTIWFFHGYGDSEHVPEGALFSFTQDALRKFEAGLPSVDIVLISYGPSWLLTTYPDRDKDPVNATVDMFKTAVVPFIEKKYKLARPYVVMGHSMGGFSTATLCAAEPAMWSKCVLVNPMLPSCDPFRDCDPNGFIPIMQGCVQHIFDCFKKMGAGAVIRANFSEDGWYRTRPMVLLEKTARLPKAFVTACRKDHIVDFKGPEEWIDLAKTKNADSIWDPVATCDHFKWPHQHVLDFLAH